MARTTRSRPDFRALGAVLCVFALAALPVAASDLGVECTPTVGANPNTGDCGARIGVGTTCTSQTHLEPTGPLTGPYQACSSITSDDDVTGDTSFTAGDLVKLRGGFSVDSGADFSITMDRDLYPDAWVQDDTPDGEKVYAARFYVDPVALVLEGTEEFNHFLAFDAAGNPELRVVIKRNGSERRLFLEVFEDNNNIETTEGAFELVLPGDGNYHWVEVGWAAATAPGSNNGSAYICLDQASPPTGCTSPVQLTTLDNDTGAIDFVRWGAVDVPSNSSIGNLDLDDFESRSSLYIGDL